MPVVFPETLDVFLEVGGYFTHAILPAYLVDEDNIGDVKSKIMGSSVKWFLSSVMPDELLDEDAHERFLELAGDLGVYGIIVWDLPTYLERREEGWDNIERCIRIVDWFEWKGFKIIPLIKGVYEDQIRYCVTRFRELGYELMAFRATEYMRSPYPPYPELPSESRDPRDLLMKYIGVIFEEGVKTLLLLGGMNPKFF